jgi:hypothetical protein
VQEPYTRGFVTADVVYSVVKAPVGWMLFLDGVRICGICRTNEAAFEVAMVAASFAVRDGDVVQVNVPSDARLSDVKQTESWPKEWKRLSETIAAARRRTSFAPFFRGFQEDLK